MQKYTVKRGDILGKIAADSGISLNDLLKANPQIKDPNKIMVGSKINLPGFAAAPSFEPDEDEIPQESYEDRIIEFFGHYIAAEVMLPGSKKAKRMKEALANELNSEYQQGNMSDAEGKQFFSGYKILEELSYSLGGEYGIQSPMRRYLINNEVRPIVVKGYEVSRSDYQFFADAWQRISMSEYGYTGKETSLTGKPMSYAGGSNNIFENYFKQNIKEEEIDPEQSFDQPSTEDLRNNTVAGFIMQRLNPFLQGMLDDIDELTARVVDLETSPRKNNNTSREKLRIGQTREIKENLVKEEIPADQLVQFLDIKDLPELQRYRAYTILRQNGHEFTDLEVEDYLQMLDKRSDDLSDGETEWILQNTETPEQPDVMGPPPELEDEE